MSGTYIAVNYDERAKDYLIGWCTSNAIPNPVNRDSIHTTVVYSRVTLDRYLPSPNLDHVAVIGNLDVFTSNMNGKTTNCLVVTLKSGFLVARHNWLRECFGATHDFQDYVPHITLSYDIGDLDISSLSIDVTELKIISEIKSPIKVDARERKREYDRQWRLRNPEKVKAQRKRYYEKHKEEAKAYSKEYRARKMNNGKPPGRRLAGEPLSDSPHAVSARKYREGNEKWKEYNRKKQAEWRAKNRERSREIARESYQRKKLRELATTLKEDHVPSI